MEIRKAAVSFCGCKSVSLGTFTSVRCSHQLILSFSRSRANPLDPYTMAVAMGSGRI